ncbi:MAG TPA: lamin tail domain-containing protein, partial [Candidatus Acidoferrum sp.]|nr:lamin tail domain-containing protein [Candidatus Acidoferrum sp.]
GNPSLAQQYLRITEIMYNPGPTNAGSPYAQQEYEFIELKNIGPVALNLVGIHFTNGVEFAFATNSVVTNLNAGQTIVLVKNVAAFIQRHGGANIGGIFTGTLDSNGERVTIVDAVNEEILDFTYNNSWYPITDGLGFSLVVVNENAFPDAWDTKANWRASGNLHGSPGVTDPAPATFPIVLISEVLANSILPSVDAIELWNTSAGVANIGGWYLSDDFFTPKKYRLTNGTTIAAGSRLVLTEAQFNPTPGTPPSFAFSSAGDEAFLFAADAAGNLLGYYHGFDFNASQENVSFGRYIPSTGEEHFVAQAANTLGTPNSAPRVGPVVISEIMYHPPDLNGADDDANEFIELFNITANTVSLFDVSFPTNSWKLKDAVDFSFATNTTLPAGGYLLVVSFDPQTNATALATFRAKYGVNPSVPVVGPYQGQLDNSAANVELAAPLAPSTNGVVYFMVDKVDYNDVDPADACSNCVAWTSAPDGFGPSLHRIVTTDYGNDPTNWVGALPSPGGAFGGGTPPAITQHPLSLVLVQGQNTNLSVIATGGGLHYQWSFLGTNVAGATNSLFPLNNVSSAINGYYGVVVFNGGGSVSSTNALVMVRSLPSILLQPTSQTNVAGSNSVFSVFASGTGTITYQWRKNGTNIVNATTTSLAIPNAQLFADAALYDVVVTDEVGSVVSQPAYLVVRVTPFLVTPGGPYFTVQGGTVIFTVNAGPVHPLLPLVYRWLPNPAAMGSITNNTSTYYPNNYLIMTNCQINGGVARVVIQNPLGALNVTATNAGASWLVILPDFDHDGVADSWETLYGMNTNNAADALLDTDGDGMKNRDEYLAGTNPTNALSLLQIVLTPTNSSVLQFQAESNISYSIQIRTNLNTGWQSLSNITASNSVRAVRFDDSQTNSERFFRVVTPRIP